MNLTRRHFMKAAATVPIVLPAASRADDSSLDTGPRDVLVCVFQRGAADGMHLVPPLGDEDYDNPAVLSRPDLRVGFGEAVSLDEFFYLHGAMSSLMSHYQENRLAIVHGTGRVPQNRSHFDAQKLTECGLDTDDQSDDGNGWIGRYLSCTSPSKPDSVFRAVGFGQGVQKSLRGTTPPIGMSSIDSFGLMMPDPADVAAAEEALRYLFESGSSLLDTESIRALDATQLLSTLQLDEPNVTYGTDEFSLKMMQVAQLIKADEDGVLGLDVICVDIGGWDTHDDQRARLDVVMAEFANGLTAFADDLGPTMDRVSVITMTEFGRRLPQNGALGTDHGNASVMFALGGGVNGSQVVANWDGLVNMNDSDGLKVTIDWRTVLSELMVARLGLDPAFLPIVFPGFTAPLAPQLNLFLPRSSGRTFLRRQA